MVRYSFVHTKKRCHLARTRAARSWYHLVSTIGPPNQLQANYPLRRYNGRARNPLLSHALHAPFRHSTSESRSRAVSEGGSHPVTSTLWQTASPYSTRIASFFSCKESIPCSARRVKQKELLLRAIPPDLLTRRYPLLYAPIDTSIIHRRLHSR